MLKICLLAAFVGAALAKNSYIFIAPKMVRAGMEFGVSGHILKAPSVVNVAVNLMNGTQSVASTTGVLKEGHPRGLTMSVPKDLRMGFYTLNISGSGGLTISETRALSFQTKSMSIFIQTDKAIYKPGQTVHFRAFAIYPDMKMFTGKLNIEIFDPNSNKIKQWIGVQDNTGVITNYLPMTSQPVKGDWKIKVTAGTVPTEKVFTIAEYVLPKFEVTVELPSYALSFDQDITATVKAKYTYGKPVKGKVSLAANLEGEQYYWHRQETAMIDGEAKFLIPLHGVRWAMHYNTPMVEVIANVTEGLTGITLNGSSKVQLYQYATKLTFAPTDPKTFKPGLKYIALLQVQQQDGRPVALSSRRVFVSARFAITIPIQVGCSDVYWKEIQTFNQPDESFSVPDTGVVHIELPTPANASSLSLTVNYGPIAVYKTVKKSYSPSDNYIQLLLNPQRLSAGGIVRFDVIATEPVSEYVYQIMSRGSIVATGIKNANGNSTFILTIPPTSKMAPNARIIIYYVRTDGEIVIDSSSFDVDGMFENKVSITMDKTSAQPGDSVNVKVTADPQSLVNLLAVDQSVLLLKSSNDITQGQIIDEIKTYNTGTFLKEMSPIDHLLQLGLQQKDLQIFQLLQRGTKSGVIVVTDAWLYKNTNNAVQKYGFLHALCAIMTNFQPLHLNIRTPSPLERLQESLWKLGAVTGTGGNALKKVETVRHLFPELWLWTNTTISTNGSATISTVVPDTITSWVASAFAVNSATGLGVAPTTAKITVFRPFFVSLNLPYSVTRGEQLALQAIVFNYLTQDVDVVLSLPQSKDYLNIIMDANGNERQDNKEQMQTVHVKAGQATSVFFPIIPATLGKIDITISARSALAADAVKRQLLIEAEGSPKEYNVPVLIDLKQNHTFTKTVPLTMPRTVVSGSQRARVTAIGDLMGASISGLDHLLRMPTGCGEQTMLGLAPDVFVTNYLQAINQFTGDVADKALKYMQSGYQRELTYQHKDGSFSAFGDRDPSGSMWLTAFVVKTFHQAKSHIFIDEDVISRAIDWMLAKQTSTGEFPEPGRVIHKDMTGGSAKGPSLTAFVLIALLENNDLTGGIQQRIKGAVTNAVQFLESQTPADDYALAITTYALELAKSQRADTLFATLNSHAIVQDGMKYWHRPANNTTPSYSYWRPPNFKKAIDVEMTSYALLVYGEKKYIIGGQNIMKWIASQRNPQGGFCSTQDTVLALQALSEFARMAYSRNFDAQVKVTAGTFTHQFSIDQSNALVLQMSQLPSIPSSITVEATGNGIAILEVSVFFNVEMDVEEPTFEVTTSILEEDINSITLQTCTRWLDTGTSGMAIEEIGIPSGFEANTERITKLGTLKRIETENKKVILYFDEIGTKPVCVTVNMLRTGLVAKSKPVPVRVYDYYEPSNQVTAFFMSTLLSNSTICSVCADCENCAAVRR